jgi:hypothetical protein
MAFETGAKTHGANDLVLTVMHDGKLYETRKHIVFAIMQSASHLGLSMRDIVNTEAKRMRKEFQSKYSARDISEAAEIVFAQTLRHCCELIRDEWTGESIQIRGLKWWDSQNGNTYHSVRIQVPSNAVHFRIVDCPMQYGYGDQWMHTGIAALRKIGFALPDGVPFSQLPLKFADAPYTRKREMFGGLHAFSF